MEKPKKDKALPSPMCTLSEIMEKLKEKDLYNEFKFTETEEMQAFGKNYKPNHLKIIKTYRFEGMSDLGDNTILYLLEDQDGNTGFILDVYGSDSNYGLAFDEFIKAIPIDEQTD